jgi:hypothetical protein
MLLHSREGSGEHRLVDVNSLVEESLNLAYHGARAENQSFKVNMERSFDPAAGQVDVYPQAPQYSILNMSGLVLDRDMLVAKLPPHGDYPFEHELGEKFSETSRPDT